MIIPRRHTDDGRISKDYSLSKETLFLFLFGRSPLAKTLVLLGCANSINRNGSQRVVFKKEGSVFLSTSTVRTVCTHTTLSPGGGQS